MKSKRMRLPNGFGQISELKGRRLRKPFRAMVTVGKNENGKPICKPLKPKAYFETYNDAYKALMEYHSNPYQIAEEITVQELFDRWLEGHRKAMTANGVKNIMCGWKYCKELYDMQVSEVRSRHIKQCLEQNSGNPSASTRNRMKSTLNQMFDYAVEYELADRNYARSVQISDTRKELKNVKQGHMPFTDEEMNILWNHAGESECIDMILVQSYSGWRPGELVELRLENINLTEGTFTGGSKTEAGMNRTVPIHHRIAAIVERKYNEALSTGRATLFRMTDYKAYHTEFGNVMKTLDLSPNHRPHDCRKHFVTLAKRYNVDEYAIKRIVGHRISDITEAVYTQRDPDWLRKEIEKIV